MLEEFTTEAGASALTIASLLFFIAVWLYVAVRVYRTRPEEIEAQARLALEGDGPAGTPMQSGPGSAA